jgi:macrolide transport system ATP-binding/permease protein
VAWASRIGERLYRFLLYLYPREFRQRYGAAMLDLFSARQERAHDTGGPLAGLRFWTEIFHDLITTSVGERLEAWGFHRRVTAQPTIASDLISRKGGSVESLLLDTKQSIRRLAQTPGFTLTALLIVGLGIGANAAVFSVVDGILFRPPPWERPDEIVWIYQDSDDGDPSSSSYPAYRDMAAHTDLFTGVTAVISGWSARHMTDEGDARHVTVSFVTAGYFPVLGLSPSRGIWLESGHDNPGAEPVAVVSHRAWQNSFAGDLDIIGRRVRLNGASVTIIGVGPKGYTGTTPGVDVDFWLSISSAGPIGGDFFWATLEHREDHWFWVLARLQPGVTAQRAQAAMNVLAQRLASEFPLLNEGRDITVFPSSSIRVHPDEDAILFPVGAVLMAVVGLVLLIACSNMANLLLARASTRGREIALRLALGATRGRLIRHLLTESVILSFAGSALGLLFAYWVGRVLTVYQPSLPGGATIEISVDTRVLVFAVVLAAVTGMLIGLIPALRASRPDLVPSLKDSKDSLGVGGRPSRRPRWLDLRNALVMLQVAVSLVLLAGAGLLVKSLMNSQNVDLGFTKTGIAIVEADVREAGYEGETGRQLFDDFKRRITGLPGVEEASYTTRLPVTPSGGSSTLEIEDYQATTGTGQVEVINADVDPDYAKTFGIPLLHGRNFTPDDILGTERVALVNEAFGRRYWGTSDVVGRRYRHQGYPDSWVQIVGVLGNVKVRTPGETPTPMFYRPLAQNSGWSRLSLVARVAGDPVAAVRTMRQELRALDADVPVTQARTMEDHVDMAMAMPLTAAGMLGLFGGLALLLASMGLYAVVAFAVARRTGEIGIRMALGASKGNVVGMVIKEMMIVVAIGVGVGIVLALMATPVLESILFDVAPSDPMTLTAVAALLMLVTLFATWLPARRAAASDPMVALRKE